jgi:protein-tyrosine phosphatase
MDVHRLANMLRVTAVLSLQSDADLDLHGIPWSVLEEAYIGSDIVVQRYPIRDFDPDDLQARLGDPVDALNALLIANHRVYVHCNAGICRAPAIVIGFLHRYRGMKFGSALQMVRDARPMVNPYMDSVVAALKPLESEQGAD